MASFHPEGIVQQVSRCLAYCTNESPQKNMDWPDYSKNCLSSLLTDQELNSAQHTYLSHRGTDTANIQLLNTLEEPWQRRSTHYGLLLTRPLDLLYPELATSGCFSHIR